jgi:hypothetical protein
MKSTQSDLPLPGGSEPLAPDGIKPAEYARRRGCTERAVYAAAKRGGIVHTASGLIDADASDIAWRVTLKRQPGPGRAPKAPDPVAAAKVNEQADALTRVQLAEARERLAGRRLVRRRLAGQLVDKAAVERELFDLVRDMRTALLTWPSRVGAILAGKWQVDGALVQRDLEAAMREELLKMDATTLKAGRVSAAADAAAAAAAFDDDDQDSQDEGVA